MSLVEDQHMVETLGSRRLYPPLRNRVRSGGPERRSQLLDAETPQAVIECHAIAAITLVNQEPRWPSIPGAALHHLLGRPLRRQKWRHRNVQDFAVDVPDDKNVSCLDAEEIAGPYARLMPLKEIAPTGGGPSTVA